MGGIWPNMNEKSFEVNMPAAVADRRTLLTALCQNLTPPAAELYMHEKLFLGGLEKLPRIS
jgi:hypothetical protein